MPLFLSQSFSQTNLDLENPGPYNSFNTLDTITTYPATNTGTPNNQANPGAPKNFYQSYVPTNTYLTNIRNNGSLLLTRMSGDNTYSIFDATNLDTERPGVDGGIPYKQTKDPTVYPITAKKVSSTIGGFNSIQGQGATKFTQTYSATNPYLP
jgi:hypothetical protein